MTITATTMSAVQDASASRWATVSVSEGHGGLARPDQVSGMREDQPEEQPEAVAPLLGGTHATEPGREVPPGPY